MVVHMQVDATVWSNKCHSSLKLVLSTLLSFSLLPHSHSLTFNQHSAGSLTHSNFTFPFSLPTSPLTFSHTQSPFWLFLTPHNYTSSTDSPHSIFPTEDLLSVDYFHPSMWEVLFSTTSHIPSKINSFENLLSICSRRFSNQYRIASNP